MLTIVVPVYNVSATLERCVSSICSQSLSDWELLLIDDGSTDDSGKLCDEIARRNPYIRAFHHANAGLSEARNTGIRNAKGDYITFVDSDDELLPSTMQPLYEQLLQHPEADILEFSVVKSSSEKEEYIVLEDECYTDACDYWLRSRGYVHTYAWNKIFRREIFYRVMFPKGRVFEDAWFMPQVLQRNPCIITSSTVGYSYKWNPEGITSKASFAQKRQLFEAQMKALELLGISFGHESEWIKDDRVGQLYLELLNLQITACSGEDKSLLLPYQKVPFRMAHSLKSFVKVLLLNTLGLKTLCRIINR